ncbi:MAG: twin-arginine translocase subunit TatC [Planctomycetota bacterium]|jgi:sec-independent protein translocase protein TatC
MGETNKKEDLLDSTMSLGDHLEELRMRMIRALLGLGLCAIICLAFGRGIIRFMQAPYDDSTAELMFNIDLNFQVDLDQGTMTEGLRQELKNKGVVLSADVKVKRQGYLFSSRRWLIDDGVEKRYCAKKEKAKVKKGKDKVKEEGGDVKKEGDEVKEEEDEVKKEDGEVKKKKVELNIYKLMPLQIIKVAAGIISYIKIALISGLLLSSPWVFYQLWMFVAAGLYPHEKKYVNIAAPFSAILFVCGAVFFIVVVAPLTLGFLVKFNEKILDVRSQFTFQDYIAFVSHLMLVFGLAFQTPSAIFFLNRTGLVSIRALNRSRKFIVLAIFIVAAMATPPDWVSQVTLAIPLYFLFELGILLSYIASRRRRKSENEN